MLGWVGAVRGRAAWQRGITQGSLLLGHSQQKVVGRGPTTALLAPLPTHTAGASAQHLHRWHLCPTPLASQHPPAPPPAPPAHQHPAPTHLADGGVVVVVGGAEADHVLDGQPAVLHPVPAVQAVHVARAAAAAVGRCGNGWLAGKRLAPGLCRPAPPRPPNPAAATPRNLGWPVHNSSWLPAAPAHSLARHGDLNGHRGLAGLGVAAVVLLRGVGGGEGVGGVEAVGLQGQAGSQAGGGGGGGARAGGGVGGGGGGGGRQGAGAVGGGRRMRLCPVGGVACGGGAPRKGSSPQAAGQSQRPRLTCMATSSPRASAASPALQSAAEGWAGRPGVGSGRGPRGGSAGWGVLDWSGERCCKRGNSWRWAGRRRGQQEGRQGRPQPAGVQLAHPSGRTWRTR